jgi:Leucine-rich repeat (LRR) protein
LKEGTFKITYKVDADTAYATYKELVKRGCLGVVDNMGIAGEDSFDNVDYFGEFINTNRLIIKAPNIKNMSWASKLVNVEILNLEDSQIEDLSWIKEMKKLKCVYLSNSSFTDLSVLSEHEDIDILDINGTKVRDISFIEKFSNLKQLLIATCPIKDYSPLFTTKSHLKYLVIDKRALEEIGEENIRNRHIGITIKTTNSIFYWL